MPELPPAELAERGIAPIKRSHWKPATEAHPDPEAQAPGTGKSKRQQKRERKVERRKGTVCTPFLQGACQYGDSCRWNPCRWPPCQLGRSGPAPCC